MKKKILFINAIDPANEVNTRRNYPNLGLGYLVSVLRKHFGEDTFDLKISDKRIADTISDFKPDLIGITAFSPNFNLAKEYAKLAKKNNIPVIMGGIHISLLPSSLSLDMDVGCIGEGEQTIIELVELFVKRGIFCKEELKEIRGICYRDGNEILLTEPRELIEDMDSIPLPARDLFKIHKHSYIFSSRGCPYRCVFCAPSRHWKKVRLFSAEYVVNEIRELVEKYDVNLISFFDDLFVVSKNRIKEIVSLFKKEKFFGKIKFTCSCRVELVDDEMARLLKEMGVVAVGMGLESGSERILKYLKGNDITTKGSRDAIEALKKYKIAVSGSFVIGSPDETKEEMLATYQFIKKNALSLVEFYILTPLPGTPVWEYAKQKKLVSDDMDWKRLNFNRGYKKAIILSEVLSKKDIYGIYRKFQRLCFIRNLQNIFLHPYRQDIPELILRKFSQIINGNFFKRD